MQVHATCVVFNCGGRSSFASNKQHPVTSDATCASLGRLNEGRPVCEALLTGNCGVFLSSTMARVHYALPTRNQHAVAGDATYASIGPLREWHTVYDATCGAMSPDMHVHPSLPTSNIRSPVTRVVEAWGRRSEGRSVC